MKFHLNLTLLHCTQKSLKSMATSRKNQTEMCNSQSEKPKWKDGIIFQSISYTVEALITRETIQCDISMLCLYQYFLGSYRWYFSSIARMNWGFAMVMKKMPNKIRGSIQLKDISVTSLCWYVFYVSIGLVT